jgi:hypothetical protein
VARIKRRFHELITKLNQLSAKIAKAIGWPRRVKSLSALVGFIKNYCSQLPSALRGARALSHDWFYVFHQGLCYMHRDFLFGIASPRRF